MERVISPIRLISTIGDFAEESLDSDVRVTALQQWV